MKLYHPINLTACGLAASIAVAWTRHPLGVLADGNPAGGGGERGGADGILAVAGDGDPWMDTGNDVVDFGLFNQDGGGHGGAIRGPGQFDGQAIHSDGGWGEVAFGSVGTNGDEGGEMVADIGTDAQAAADGDSGGVIDVMMSPHAYGAGDGVIDAAANGGLDISIEATTADEKDEKDDGLVGNEVDAFVADDDGAFGSRTEDAKLSNKKARNDISIISIPEDGIKQLDQISRSLRGSGLEKVESSTVPKAADDSDDGGSEDIARKNNVESSDAKKSGEDMAMTASSLDDAPTVVERNLGLFSSGTTIINSAWNPSHELSNCEGDCDNDADCERGLVCFQRDGGTPVPPGCSGTIYQNMDYCWLPFESGAIGSVSSGSMSDPAKMMAGGVVTISGQGGDIWDRSDNFFFSRVTFDQYFTVEVYTKGFDPNFSHHPWAKFGLMVRDTSDPRSTHVSAFVSPTNVMAQIRPNVGGSTTHVDANSDPQGGVWLRIDRIGYRFQALFKKDGDTSSYQQIWAGEISMSPNVLVGVALSSNSASSDSVQFSRFSPTWLRTQANCYEWFWN